MRQVAGPHFAAFIDGTVKIVRKLKYTQKQKGPRSGGRRAWKRCGGWPAAVLASAAELVEKQQRAAGEHAEQGDSHCHCQIHAADS
ncbi:hypothetical protein AB4851_28810 [Burkholderia sp. 22PA0099]|uniref:hypothetical protein n=1 Tax=Burkholderia sp. 22PA0099 TaxID=3237372 RepID=UPI0039C01BBA